MDGVKRVSKKGITAKHASSVDHRRIQKSTTLNRRFVRRPNAKQSVGTSGGQKKTATVAAPAAKVRSVAGAVRRPAKGQGGLIQRKQTVQLKPSDKKRLAQIQEQAKAELQKTRKEQAGRVEQHQLASAARAKMAARRTPVVATVTPKERKDQAIQQALKNMARAEAKQVDFGAPEPKKQHFWQKRRFAIATGMAVVSLALLGYLVHLNLPDLSVRVAAMQAGISRVYPGYLPSNYRLDGTVKEDNGTITMSFKNDIGKVFTITEQKSSWNSVAVLANYVKKNWGDDYSIAKGQGLTIYVADSKAAWVNGGVLYVIDGEDAGLNSGDLHDIAVSL